jgi:hypothetical protein
MWGNGVAAYRVRLEEHPENKPHIRRSAYLICEVDHFGSNAEIKLPVTEVTAAVLAELLLQVSQFLRGQKEYVFDHPELNDLTLGEHVQISHPLLDPLKKTD